MAIHDAGTPAAGARGVTRREWLGAGTLLLATRPARQFGGDGSIHVRGFRWQQGYDWPA